MKVVDVNNFLTIHFAAKELEAEEMEKMQKKVK